MLMQLHPNMLKWICLQGIYNISKPSLIFTPTLKADVATVGKLSPIKKFSLGLIQRAKQQAIAFLLMLVPLPTQEEPVRLTAGRKTPWYGNYRGD